MHPNPALFRSRADRHGINSLSRVSTRSIWYEDTPFSILRGVIVGTVDNGVYFDVGGDELQRWLEPQTPVPMRASVIAM